MIWMFDLSKYAATNGAVSQVRADMKQEFLLDYNLARGRMIVFCQLKKDWLSGILLRGGCVLFTSHNFL